MANSKILYSDDIRASSGGMIIGPTGESDLILRTHAQTALTIDGSNRSATFAGDVTVTGNLTVNGTQTILNTTTLDVEDLNITIAKGVTTSTGADGAGITIEGPTNNASLIWDHANQYLEFNKDVFTQGSLVIGTTSTKVGRIYNSSGVMALEAYTARQISFGNATNGEHVRIDENGKVGIGTNDPSEQLDVVGNINASGNITVGGTVDGVDISGLPTFTTVGTNFAQLGNVSVASYIRINADETLSYLNAAQFLNAIGGVDGSAYLPLAGGTMTGSLTISDSLSNPNPLLTLYNNTNGGGSTILFGDQSPQSQTGKITFYHADGSSQGGNASFYMTSTEADLVLVLGDGTNTGRIAVGSKGDTAEVDYGFLGDVNTGMVRTSADNVSLVAGGVRGVGVGSTAVSLKYAGSTKIATTNTGVNITGNIVGTGVAQFSGGSGTGVKALSIGSASQTNYTLQDWVNDTHGSTQAYIIAYGSGNAQVGNFAMKNLESGGEIFFELAGSVEPLRLTSTSTKFQLNTLHNDNIKLSLGTSDDFNMFHNGTDTAIQNITGDLYITNKANDKDIIFRSDDGSGGFTPYFRLDGSDERLIVEASNGMLFYDNVKAKFGNGGDLQIYHTGSASIIDNITGTLFIRQFADNEDIRFQCDDGNGGVETYFYLDGDAGGTNPITIFPDSSYLKFGSSQDLSIVHSGSGSEISHNGTGDLVIQNTTDDKDVIFKSDNGSGGITTYFLLDGSQAQTRFEKDAQFGDSIKGKFGSAGDLRIYHNSVDSYIENLTGELRIMGDDWALRSSSSQIIGYDTSNDYVTFSKDARWTDNEKAEFGDSADLQIYHDGSDSIIKDGGTGSLDILSSHVHIKSSGGTSNMAQFFSGGHSYIYANNVLRIEASTSGASITGDLTVTSNVLNRAIPYVIHTGWGDDTSTTANKIIPLGNSVTEQNVSAADGQHFFVAPYAGSVKKIIMKNVAGTLSSSFTTELKLYINGANVTSSGELTASSSAITWEPSSSNTFSAADEISLVYQKSASGKYWREVALTMVLTMNGQDI